MLTFNNSIFKSLRNDNLNTGAAGLTLFLTLVYLYIGAWICLWCGGTLGGFIYPAAAGVAMVSAAMMCGLSEATVKGALCGVAIIMLCTGLSAVTDDYSYDGNTYHQEIIVYFLEGWNPLTRATPAADCSPWSIHYAKALELAAACVAASTGLIETGKTVNMLLVVGTGLIAFRFFKYLFPLLSKTLRTVLTLVVAGNVVGMAQVLTFYTDYATYYLVVLTIIFACDYMRSGSWKTLLLTAFVTVLAAGIKFTVLFYQCFAMAAIVGWCVWHKRYRQSAIISLATLCGVLVGVLALGYHPYVTNTFIGGNPFYPLIGSAQTDIMTSNTPEIFATHNRICNFFSSLVTVAFPKYDQRAGGFGPLMPLMLVLGFWVIVMGVLKTGKSDSEQGSVQRMLLYMASMALISCFCFEQSWWARYICQLWLVVVAATLSALLVPKMRVWGLVLATMALVSGATALAGGAWQGRKCHLQRQQIYSNSAECMTVVNAWPATPRHFKEHNINIVEVDSIPADNSFEIVNFYGSDPKAKTPKVLITKKS